MFWIQVKKGRRGYKVEKGEKGIFFIYYFKFGNRWIKGKTYYLPNSLARKILRRGFKVERWKKRG